MATKKRPVTLPTTTDGQPVVLLPQVLADLRYLEPARTRERVISVVNEAFLRIMALERIHQEPDHTPLNKRAPKKRAR